MCKIYLDYPLESRPLPRDVVRQSETNLSRTKVCSPPLRVRHAVEHRGEFIPAASDPVVSLVCLFVVVPSLRPPLWLSMTTSVDDGTLAMLDRFKLQAAANRVGGSSTARSSRDIRSRAGFAVSQPNSGRRADGRADGGRSSRLAAAAAQTALTHGIPPIENAAVAQAAAASVTFGPYAPDLAHPRTWEQARLTLTPQRQGGRAAAAEAC